MFIQPCFIKRISSDLKERLKEVGYRDAGKVRYYGESQYIYCEGGIFYESPCIIEARYNTFIDCGTNEELFLALAAMRNDTDKWQLFVFDGIDVPDYFLQKGDMWICSLDKHLVENCHKATVEEIIELFKKD